MVTVDCPICRTTISGMGEAELSENLQAHMIREHALEGACNLGAASGAEEACLPSASGELADAPYQRRMDVEANPPPRMEFVGEDAMQTVRCPVCGETVMGHTGEDLSGNLRAHAKSEHGIVPVRRRGR